MGRLILWAIVLAIALATITVTTCTTIVVGKVVAPEYTFSDYATWGLIAGLALIVMYALQDRPPRDPDQLPPGGDGG